MTKTLTAVTDLPTVSAYVPPCTLNAWYSFKKRILRTTRPTIAPTPNKVHNLLIAMDIGPIVGSELE